MPKNEEGLVECPKCRLPHAEEIIDEVDIGVGIQRHLRGWACGGCGLVAACDRCGRPDPEHAEWCETLKEEGPEEYGFPYDRLVEKPKKGKGNRGLRDAC